jgi:hypothetical protein
MATTHVFIVDVNTFKCHLEYLFAGTGAKDHKVDFNDNKKSSLRYAVENILTGMIADSQHVRKDDFVVFYLQQNKLMKCDIHHHFLCGRRGFTIASSATTINYSCCAGLMFS